jgi:hypothetical protein
VTTDPSPPARQAGRSQGPWRAVVLVVIALLVGALIRGFFPPFVLDDPFWRSFFTSAGFGGSAAVLAALIAYAAARQAANTTRVQAEADREVTERRDRKAQWWLRAEWALNQVTSGTTERAEVGQKVLEALAGSEWAEEHEFDIIAAATEDALSAKEVGEDEGAPSGGSTGSDSSDRMNQGGHDG